MQLSKPCGGLAACILRDRRYWNSQVARAFCQRGGLREDRYRKMATELGFEGHMAMAAATA